MITNIEDPDDGKTILILTKEEAIILYKLLEHQYIHYDNTSAHELIRRISDFIHRDS